MPEAELIDAPVNQMPPVVYEPNEAAIAQVREQFAPLLADPDICKTPEGYDRVKAAIKITTTMRSTVEKARVALGRDALEYKRKVDAEAKHLTADIEGIEKPLRQRKEAVDRAEEEKARAIVAEQMRKEKAEADRVIAERAAAERAQREAEAKEREAERAKLAAERAEFERQRAAQAEADRIEREKQQAEQAELRRQAMEYEAKMKAEREAAQRELAELRAERERAERAKFEAEAKRRADEQAVENARLEFERRAAREAFERDDLARRQKEEAERLAAERKAEEEARPDAAKIKAFGEGLAAYADESKLTVTTPKARGFIVVIDAAIADLVAKCRGYKAR